MTTPAKTYPPGVYEALNGKNYYIPFGVTVGEPEPTPPFLLELTQRDLKQQQDAWLRLMAKFLYRYVRTPHEATARALNRKIQDELHRRSGFGD